MPSSQRNNLDWPLRSVNTVPTGEAKFQHLHEKSAEEVQGALDRACKHIDRALNMIAGRLGLDHDRVFFGRFAVPVIVRYLGYLGYLGYLDQRNGVLDERGRDKLLFWFAQAGMWGRFSGSTETYIDQDLEALEGEDGGLDNLLRQLRLWHGGLRVEPGHFTGWGKGARFYPVLYLLTRMGEPRDWGTSLPLKASLLGKMSSLEMHHIFPKAQLYKHGYPKSEVNALANFCFLTKDTNLAILDSLPALYFPQVEAAHPGALASQWIPADPELWKIENYGAFLAARETLLAEEANRCLRGLLHGEDHWLDERGAPTIAPSPTPAILGGIDSEEEQELEALNAWVARHGLPRGEIAFELSDEETGEQQAVLDLAWPHGLQEELSQPVAVLLNESTEMIALASQAGYRCFTNGDSFRRCVEQEILAQPTGE